MTYAWKLDEENPFDEYEVDRSKLIVNSDGEVPLIHWPVQPNFGDDLSPWLISKMTNRPTRQNKGEIPSYIAIGSVIKRTRDETIVWGSGCFGTEQAKNLNKMAKYLAVRGPLTRCLLRNQKIRCPKVYGDPALLVPMFFNPKPKKIYKTGVVIRWSDKKWKNLDISPDVKLIDLHTSDVESVLMDMLQCEKIITSSLHGLIISDAYGIPSAWISSRTPKGGEFKFFDYFLSVNKVRYAQKFALPKSGQITDEYLSEKFKFDKRKLKFNPYKLLNACPFLRKKAEYT